MRSGPRPVGRESDAGDALAGATHEVHDEEDRRESERERGQLPGQLGALVRRGDDRARERRFEQAEDRVDGAREEREHEHHDDLFGQRAAIGGRRWRRRETPGGPRSFDLIHRADCTHGTSFGRGGSSRLRLRGRPGSTRGGIASDGEARRGRSRGRRRRHDRRMGIRVRPGSGPGAGRRDRSRTRRTRRVEPGGGHGARAGRFARHRAARHLVDRLLRGPARPLRHRLRLRRPRLRDPRVEGRRRTCGS